MIEIRDPVHGFIEVTNQEAAIVNSVFFQRLRGIHQLAMAYLVYPGATHTRFEHSLGVMHVADRLARRVGLPEDETPHVRLAALLHDIGHGPFSHVSEYVLGSVNRDLAAQLGVEQVHERITVDIIRCILRPEGFLNDVELKAVENILDRTGDTTRTVQRDIVSGPLDADKLDYLLRDSHYAGVKYGIYDLARLIRVARKIEDPPLQSYLGVDAEDVSVVDQFIIAVHNMTSQVYRHNVRRIADAMMVRSVLKAIADGNKEIAQLYTYKSSDAAYLKEYLACGDDKLVTAIVDGPGGAGKDLMRRLVERRLVKEVFHEPLKDCGDPDLQEELVARDNRREPHTELEDRIADVCCVNQRHAVFVELVRSKPPRRAISEPELDLESIHVVWPDGRRGLYDRVSQFFRYGALKGDDFLCVYAPIDETDERRKKQRYIDFRERIASVIPVKREEPPKEETSHV